MTNLPFRMVSYNIRKALGTDRRRDPGRVLGVIAALEADIVALQEADLRLPPRRPVFRLDEIEARTGMRAVTFDHGRDSLGYHGNAILVRPGFKVVAQGHHDLPGLEPRGFVVAELAHDSGARLRVVGAHLGLLRHSRRQQLSALIRQFSPDKVLALPTLMAGDFNERSLSVGLGRLAPRFRILSGGPTYHSRHPVFALDRIAVSDGIEPVATSVYRSFEASRASDHLPLIADLELRLPAAPGPAYSIEGTT